MAKFKHYYLIRVAYLGFRLHGWQKQPGVKTIHSLIDRTLKFVLQHEHFKTLGASRTDAMVSANNSAFELFLNVDLPPNFENDFQRNLPPDIFFKSIERTDEIFNIIQSVKSKTYRYYFSFGSKPNPLSASILAWFPNSIDLEKLNEGLQLFLGTHNFISFCTQPKPNSEYYRTIDAIKVELNTDLTASFFPQRSYFIEVKSKGFLRNQIRLMIGALYLYSTSKIEKNALEKSLIERYDFSNQLIIAPASGLHLHEIEF